MTPSAEYMVAYRKKRYQERKLKIIELLGGDCSQCSSLKFLEIHHIDPSKKSFDVMIKCWWMAWDKLLVEINKCKLLCKKCHTIEHTKAKGTHGTLSAWRYCKCNICRETYNSYMRIYKRNRRKNNMLS